MKRIGIIGGGQLGKMMILDAKRLDYHFVILDPVLNCPAHSIADEHIVASFDDHEAIKQLASKTDVVTYEFEHISLKALQELEEMGYQVYPTSKTLSHIQNKYIQNNWLREHHIPIPDYLFISNKEELLKAHETFGYPMILKTCTGGYDGKGNAVILKAGEEEFAYETLGAGRVPLMIEEWIPFKKEVSILACRSINGEIAVFPVAENVHKNSILDETIVPAQITESAGEEAFQVARACVEAFEAYGMICIELFVTKEDRILVNELAPRPHNSGHYTIEGCYTSQFEQHIRAILGLPLGNPNLIRPTAMKNIIGDKEGKVELKGLEEAYRYANAKLHIYGKETVSIGRKMGHITATGETIEEALSYVRGAFNQLSY